MAIDPFLPYTFNQKQDASSDPEEYVAEGKIPAPISLGNRILKPQVVG
jgi:hypothetical protein